MTKDKCYAGELAGEGGSSGESRVNLFTCPECDTEHAFPAIKPGETPQCPKCGIPLKAKDTK